MFRYNEVRGCSYYFGFDAAKRFLDDNNLLAIVRAHEAQIDGFLMQFNLFNNNFSYKMHKWNAKESFPVVITIFSAPNYCDIYNNKGALLKFDVIFGNIYQIIFTFDRTIHSIFNNMDRRLIHIYYQILWMYLVGQFPF